MPRRKGPEKDGSADGRRFAEPHHAVLISQSIETENTQANLTIGKLRLQPLQIHHIEHVGKTNEPRGQQRPTTDSSLRGGFPRRNGASTFAVQRPIRSTADMQ